MSADHADPIGGKSLPHDPPLSIDPAKETFFMTIGAANRFRTPLLPHAAALLESAVVNKKRGNWFARISLFMPDHLHALLRFRSDASLRETICSWKRWTTKAFARTWQTGFFDRRLRHEESAAEKARSILENPVRAGLVSRPADWPHVYLGGADH